MAFSIPTETSVGDCSSASARAGILVEYLDVARAQWWRGYTQTSATAAKEHFDIARMEIDFRKPLQAGDRVRVELRSDRIGTSSFTLSYKILREPDGVVMAEAHTLQVFVDPKTQRPRPIGPETLQWLRSQA